MPKTVALRNHRWMMTKGLGAGGGVTLTAALIPLASDGFTWLWNETDGRGHSAGVSSYLTTTAGAGGGGVSWSGSSGSTWVTSDGRAQCSTLGASTAQAWVDVGESDVRVELDAYRSSGACGVLIRYVDSTNYAYVTNNGSNIRVHEVVSGSVSTLYDSAETITSGGTYAIEVNGTTCEVYYNAALITTETLNAALTSATKFGLWTNNTANTLNDFVVYDLATYPDGTMVNLSKAVVTVGATTDGTSALIPGSTVTQHSFVNSNDAQASRTSSDPLWGNLGPACIHLRHFGFTNNMSAQASGADEATRVTNTIGGENISFTEHDDMLTLLEANGVTEVVLKPWGFPEWMLDSGTGSSSVDQTFQTTYRAEAAAYVRAFIKRYNTDNQVSGISIIAVDWGHEWKGGYSSDQARFVADYDAVHAAVTAEDSSVKMYGPYRVIRGNSSVNFGQTDDPSTREPIITDDSGKIEYWLANATAFDGLSFDAKTWVDAAPTLTYDESVEILPVWSQYIEKLKELTGYTSEPLMLSEGYAFNINDYTDFSEAEQGALHAGMFWYLVRYGIKYFFHWIIEKPSGQNKYGYWNSTNDNPTGNVVTTPAYDVHLAFKNNFSNGTALYPVTITGDIAGLYVLASATKVLFVNLRSTSRTVRYGATNYTMVGYETKVISR